MIILISHSHLPHTVSFHAQQGFVSSKYKLSGLYEELGVEALTVVSHVIE